MVVLRYPFGATPLDPDEMDGLIPTHIRLQSELDEWESVNIAAGRDWGMRNKKKNILSEEFLLALHRKMFGDTWRWAGTFRKTNKNIGVDWKIVPASFRDAMRDAEFWIAHKTFPMREIALILHYRLVCVHAFPNGNGRHARMVADILLARNNESPLKWHELDRTAYIQALRSADHGDMEPLKSLLL